MAESDRSERTLAVFFDFENLALGIQDRKDRLFDISKVLTRLVEKGKIVFKRAYADWSRYADYKLAFHQSGVELVEIPRRGISGKNSADIRMVVDALELSYTKEHIDTFIVVSGDSDFSPLVAKLKENGKHVIGLGIKESTSELLLNSCDEFIYYEDLERPLAQPPPIASEVPLKKQEAFRLLLDSVEALLRENKPILHSSMVKDTMKRKKPSFNETYYGYRTFSELLEDAEKHGLIELNVDPRSGTYVIAGFGQSAAEKKKVPRRRRPKKASRPSPPAPEPAPR
ncbi:MAG: NYN domain-containing protein [bacterium]